LRKPHLLDGDGLVQRLSLADGVARYQNAFVRTPKFIAEEKAGTFHFTTWSMRPLGGLIPGGGLTSDGTRWVSCRPGFFLPCACARGCSGGCSLRSSGPPVPPVG